MDTDALWQLVWTQLKIDDPATRTAFETAADIRRLTAGNSLIAQDEAEDHVFILMQGEAQVILLSEAGREVWLDTLPQGNIIGEIAALMGAPRTSEIIAGTSLLAAAFPGPVFLDLVAQHGQMGVALARQLAVRVQHTTKRMFELSAMAAPGRVYAELIRLSEPGEDPETVVIRPTPSLTDIARRISTTRETVSRTISKLEKRGLLKRHKDGFELLDPDRLRGS